VRENVKEKRRKKSLYKVFTYWWLVEGEKHAEGDCVVRVRK